MNEGRSKSRMFSFPENGILEKRDFKVPKQSVFVLIAYFSDVEFIEDSYELLIEVLSRIF